MKVLKKIPDIEKNRTASYAAGIGVLLVVAVSLLSAIVNRTGITDPRVKVVTQNMVEGVALDRERRYQMVKQAMNGEVAVTTERVKEATGVALAVSALVASGAGRGRVPASAANLVALLLEHGLPAGLSAGPQPASLTSTSGTIVVRYRREPLGIEVISLGKNREAGQAILIRIPTDERVNESGIWLAAKLDEVVIPGAFAHEAELIAAGWQPDALPVVE
jgi:hypothetical protein